LIHLFGVRSTPALDDGAAEPIEAEWLASVANTLEKINSDITKI
jgi:hypothetical protein